MKIAPVLAASLLFGLVACSASNTPDSPGSDDPGGIEGPGQGVEGTGSELNPDGVPYPTDNIGTIERKGSKPGNRIANYKFLGYKDADKSQGLQEISLADYFDPTGSRYKIIHIQAAGVWCSACQAETRAVVPLKEEIAQKGAVWLVSIAEGGRGVPSTQKDMDGWIADFKSPYTHWLDPGNKNLGPFYDATALPWNANIDATTMEILTSGTGAVVDAAGIHHEIDEALEMASKSTLRTAQ
jgi:hypothetical protein